MSSHSSFALMVQLVSWHHLLFSPTSVQDFSGVHIKLFYSFAPALSSSTIYLSFWSPALLAPYLPFLLLSLSPGYNSRVIPSICSKAFSAALAFFWLVSKQLSLQTPASNLSYSPETHPSCSLLFCRWHHLIYWRSVRSHLSSLPVIFRIKPS